MAISAALSVFAFCSATEKCHADVKVRGYTRKDGTYVKPHYRSDPDGIFSNNWSTKGNINPYTGKRGTLVNPPERGRSQRGTYYTSKRSKVRPSYNASRRSTRVRQSRLSRSTGQFSASANLDPDADSDGSRDADSDANNDATNRPAGGYSTPGSSDRPEGFDDFASEQILAKARSLLRECRFDEAKTRLLILTSRYGNTEAAVKAKKLLHELL